MVIFGATGALSLSAIAWLAACGSDKLGGGGKEQTKVIPEGHPHRNREIRRHELSRQHAHPS